MTGRDLFLTICACIIAQGVYALLRIAAEAILDWWMPRSEPPADRDFTDPRDQ